MSNTPLPKKVDPRKLAERAVQITGSVEVSALPRLVSFLCQDSGTVEASLRFAVDEQHLRTLSGEVTGQVYMTCQRCLEPVAVDVEGQLQLAVVLNDEQARDLPRHYDPLLVEDEEVELLSVIEDELILSLPSVPMHDSCTVRTRFGDEPDAAHAQQDKPNPFSVLAQLKSRADKS